MPQLIAPDIDPMPQPKPVTQTGRILKALKQAGKWGVPNHKFAQMGILCYSKRIQELRAEGHDIYCERMFFNGKATGTFMYYLRRPKSEKAV